MRIAGRYETLRHLGSGGMGEVHLARDEQTGALVAVKLLRLEVGGDTLARFQREIALLSTVSHPAIVRVLDQGEHEGRLYYVMEHVGWPTLGERMLARAQDGKLFEAREALELLGHLAPALDHVHALGIVHRDIKPSNLLVSDGLDVRVIDFGLAGLLAARMTSTGAILGSMLYMSPEQVRADKTLDPRSDVFQVGLVLYELLSGQRAYTDILQYRRELREGREPFVPVHEANARLDRRFAKELMRALAVDPDARPASAGELLRRLRSAAVCQERPARSVPPRPPVRPAAAVRVRRPRKRLLCAVLLLAGAAWGYLHLFGSWPSDLREVPGFFRTQLVWTREWPRHWVVLLRSPSGSERQVSVSGEKSRVATLTGMDAHGYYEARLVAGGLQVGPPLRLPSPRGPAIEAIELLPGPSGVRLRVHTSVDCRLQAKIGGTSGASSSIASSEDFATQHELPAAVPTGRPFDVELILTSRLGETWTTQSAGLRAP